MIKVRCPAHRRASAEDLVGGEAADRGGPGGVFWLAVAAAQKIGFEDLPAGAEPFEECAVVQPFADQGMRDAEHQRDVGAGADRVPGRLQESGQVVAQWADQVKFDAALARRDQVAASDVLAGATAADIIVL